MNNVIALCVTLFFVFFIIQLNKYFEKKTIKKIKYSQSFIHNAIKDIIPKKHLDKPKIVSQLSKHVSKNMVRVIVIDEIAYWIKDNIFYTAKTEDESIVHETAKPVDTENMPKKELDKMLFILDNLRKEETHDSDSTGNQ